MNEIALRITYVSGEDTFVVEADDFDNGYGIDLLDALIHFAEVNEDGINQLQDRIVGG